VSLPTYVQQRKKSPTDRPGDVSCVSTTRIKKLSGNIIDNENEGGGANMKKLNDPLLILLFYLFLT